jgi:hypothetical protein
VGADNASRSGSGGDGDSTGVQVDCISNPQAPGTSALALRVYLTDGWSELNDDILASSDSVFKVTSEYLDATVRYARYIVCANNQCLLSSFETAIHLHSNTLA